MKCFSYFFQKTRFDISCKLSPGETICMKCQERKEKERKISWLLTSVEFVQRVVMVKVFKEKKKKKKKRFLLRFSSLLYQKSSEKKSLQQKYTFYEEKQKSTKELRFLFHYENKTFRLYGWVGWTCGAAILKNIEHICSQRNKHNVYPNKLLFNGFFFVLFFIYSTFIADHAICISIFRVGSKMISEEVRFN